MFTFVYFENACSINNILECYRGILQQIEMGNNWKKPLVNFTIHHPVYFGCRFFSVSQLSSLIIALLILLPLIHTRFTVVYTYRRRGYEFGVKSFKYIYPVKVLRRGFDITSVKYPSMDFALITPSRRAHVFIPPCNDSGGGSLYNIRALSLIPATSTPLWHYTYLSTMTSKNKYAHCTQRPFMRTYIIFFFFVLLY